MKSFFQNIEPNLSVFFFDIPFFWAENENLISNEFKTTFRPSEGSKMQDNTLLIDSGALRPTQKK